MNHIINKTTNRLDTTTYSAIQTVRYHSKSKKKTSLDYFQRKDVRYDPVDKTLLYHLQTAHVRHKKIKIKPAEKAQRAKILQID
jgi:hypothetical protein